MLTDYHVHLRPDEADTGAERFFTAANAERYRRCAREAGVGELGIAEHIHRFRQALDIWTHPYWREEAHDDIDAYCEFLAAEEIKVGIEADYISGAEERTAELLAARSFDFVVGSVHFLGDGAVDHDRWDVWDLEGRDPERIWSRYFEQLAAAASSGLFDILAHPDLVKVWGPARPGPGGDLARFYEPAVEAIARSAVAVEVSTAGLRKPVDELYPARRFAELCVEAGVPFSLSSDAHLPEQIGYAYDRAISFLRDIGVERIAVFNGRERSMVPLG